MKRTTRLFIALAALLTAPAFAAEKKVPTPAPKKEEAKPKEEAKAEPHKEEAKAEPAKAEAKKEDAKPASARAEAAEKPKAEASHKSNGLATTLAFVPGIAVHGAGHMYAGSWMKGLGLLAIEAGSIGVGMATYNAAASDLDKMLNNKNNKIPTSVGESYGRLGVLFVCGAAFLYTWFDDMAGASTAVDGYNRKADAAAQMGFQLIPAADGLQVAMRKSF